MMVEKKEVCDKYGRFYCVGDKCARCKELETEIAYYKAKVEALQAQMKMKGEK